MQLQAGTDWPRVWNSLHNTRNSEGARSGWYVVILDNLPTHTRLHMIRLVESETCSLCGKQDTTLHWFKECVVSKEIWERP